MYKINLQDKINQHFPNHDLFYTDGAKKKYGGGAGVHNARKTQ